MRVSTLGQYREAGPVYTMYSKKSIRPFPYKDEEELIREGIVTNLYPPWASNLWPGTVPPPPIPSSDGERMFIRRGMRKLVWPHAGPWNLNFDDSDRTQEMFSGVGQMSQDSKVNFTLTALGLALIGISTMVKKPSVRGVVIGMGSVLGGLGVAGAIKSIIE